MNEPKPKRPWRRRKRTYAFAAAWMLISYVAVSGPAMYCACRWWIHPNSWNAVFAPVRHTEYVSWWRSLGTYHAARDWRAARVGPAP